MIECIFGVFKRKYKILKTTPEYKIETQVDIILGLTTLFNFTRLRDSNIVDNYIYISEGDIEDIQPTTTESTTNSNKKIDTLRDQIAEDMWKDYQQYISSN